MTGQRRVIARVLSEAEDHPDVEELYRRATQLDSHISIATVYRTVRLFEEKGILERRDFGGGRARYEATEHGRHYHLIDVDTGRVIEFEDRRTEALMRKIAARLGFDLVSHRLELFGRKAGLAQPDDAFADVEPDGSDPHHDDTQADPPTAASGSQTRNTTLSHLTKSASAAEDDVGPARDGRSRPAGPRVSGAR